MAVERVPPVRVRVADDRDLPALARLRRDWTAERTGAPDEDAGFDRVFAAWWRSELPRRTFWLAEAGTERSGFTAVGSLNVVEIGNMPRPGARPGRWGYVGNAFVVASYADRGVAAALLTAAVEHARARRYQRLVLRPTPSSAPFYLRHGFTPAGEGMLMFVPNAAEPNGAGR
ncbi:MAG: GNAT family N-acetyltransferase [Pseudonocardia sp.]|nr:GNAT family N-acetyltransferase [Pseudonocardia sp.]